MENSAQTIATFTGALIRREHALGQKIVQLLFRENDQNWLCVSSNLIHAKLIVGQQYHIEGEFKQFGDRQYIHEPVITNAKRQQKLPVKRMSVVGGIVAGVLTVGGVAFAATHNSTVEQPPSHTASHVITEQPVTTAADTTQQAAPAADVPAPADNTPTPVKVVAKSNNTVVAPAPAAPVVPAADPVVTSAVPDPSPTAPADPGASPVDPGTGGDTGTPSTPPVETPTPDPTTTGS